MTSCRIRSEGLRRSLPYYSIKYVCTFFCRIKIISHYYITLPNKVINAQFEFLSVCPESLTWCHVVDYGYAIEQV